MSARSDGAGSGALALRVVPAVLLAGALLVGCGGAPAGRAPSTAPSSGTPTVLDPPEPSPTAAPPAAEPSAGAAHTADEVRRSGRALTVGEVTVHVLDPSGSGVEDDVADGAATLTPAPSPAPTAAAPDAPVLVLAGTPATTVEVLADGTAVLRDDDGAVVVAVAADGARLRGGAGGMVEVLPRTRTDAADGATRAVRVVVGATALVSADWADRGDEGGLSLVVVPRPWVRTAGAAGVEAVWSALERRTALGTDATGPGMRDQLECHALGAPDKESWNLEPWRPDVGPLATLAARCNPD